MNSPMDHLWAPWRNAYVNKADSYSPTLFSDIAQSNEDEKNLVVFRGKSCFALLNRFPYNAGHTMVLPYRAIPDLDDLSDDEMSELFQTVRTIKTALKTSFSPHGFNVGINLGEAAGAGISAHLHVHVVPRWKHDVNFMTATALTRIHPNDLESVWKKLTEALNTL